MRQYRAFLVGGLGVLCGSVAACDLVAGIGTYCNVDEDPSCGKGSGGSTTSTETGGGGTGGTTATACMPGETRGCYSGPASTRMVGTCQDGLEKCNDEGTAFGSCEGEVLPGAEKPDAIGDEACDGYGAGEPIWWRTFGDDKDQWPDAIATDKDGSVYVCGTFEGTLQFDETPALVSQGGKDIFLVKLDKEGKAVWSKRFGDGNDQVDCHMAADPNGVAIAGTWYGTMYFGGKVLGGNFEKVYVARFGSSGNPIWSTPLQVFTGHHLTDIATLPTGDVVMSGWLSNSNQDGGSDAFVLQMSATDGAVGWSKRISDEVYQDQTGNQAALDVSANASGDIAILGNFDVPQYGKGLVIYRYDNAGVLVDHKEYQVSGDGGACDVQSDFELVLGPGAEQIVSGSFWCTLYLDAFTFNGPTDDVTGNGDRFWAKVNPNWTVPWAHQYGGFEALLSPLQMAIDPGGNVVVAGKTSTFVDFGGGNSGVTAGGGTTVFAKVTSKGAHSWTKSFSGGEQDNAHVASLPDGSAVFAQSFLSMIVVGTKAEPALGARDVIIGKLAP